MTQYIYCEYSEKEKRQKMKRTIERDKYGKHKDKIVKLSLTHYKIVTRLVGQRK